MPVFRKLALLGLGTACYFAVCAILIAWIYRSETTNRPGGWLGAVELAIPTAIISFSTWLRPLFKDRQTALWGSAWTSLWTLLLLAGYACTLNFLLGPDSPILSVFGSDCGKLFRDDMGILYCVEAVPLAAICSGLICYLMLRFANNRVK